MPMSSYFFQINETIPTRGPILVAGTFSLVQQTCPEFTWGPFRATKVSMVCVVHHTSTK